MKLNENIEVFKNFILINNFELFRYLLEHVKMFNYDIFGNKIYCYRSIYLNDMYYYGGREIRENKKILNYVRQNYTREEIKNSLYINKHSLYELS